MTCPKCGCAESYIVDSREKTVGKRRRRKCKTCGCTWSTYEVPEDAIRALVKAVRAISTLPLE